MRYRWIHQLVLLSVFLPIFIGCNSKYSPMVDVPFCVVDDPGLRPGFEKNNMILAKYSGGGFSDTLSRGWSVQQHVHGANSDTMLFALVSCDEIVDVRSDDLKRLLDGFTEKTVPKMCPGQKIVAHKVLHARASERAKALGWGGYFHFPKVDLPCKVGRLIQDNNYTFHQLMESFSESVDGYIRKNQILPSSFEALQQDTLADPLPKDPWGTVLHFARTQNAIELISGGPDKKLGTSDDVNILTKRKMSESGSGFSGIEFSYHGNYRKFLKSRGIE